MQSIIAKFLQPHTHDNIVAENHRPANGCDTKHANPINRSNMNELQLQWLNSHPIYQAIKTNANIHTYMKHITPAQSYMTCGPNPAWLLPSSEPCPTGGSPQLQDYVQLPIFLWVPEWFYPNLVPAMPCNMCHGTGTRQRWSSGGPRVIHDMNHTVYLHCFEYKCTKCSSVYKGTDRAVRSKLPRKVQLKYTFHTTHAAGVTLDLLQHIVASRTTGQSLNKLQQFIRELRYERMHNTIVDYYNHCKTYQHICSDYQPTPLPPILHNAAGYYDHEPLSVHTMAEIYTDWCKLYEQQWKAYTQQLTADYVSIDSSHKIPKRVKGNAFTKLWSMADISTGVILQQQMLTNEANADIQPMLYQHVARCASLGKNTPSRVCTDRGVLDAKLIGQSMPDAHVNVDPWHFQQLFLKTLDRRSELDKACYREFCDALYSCVNNQWGIPTADYTHAEPEQIIDRIDCIIKRYSIQSSGTVPVTIETREWWANQKSDIQNKRILSNPITHSNQHSIARVSSSAQENYHRQINKVTTNAKFGQQRMHYFLQHFNHRWNVSRRRQCHQEHNFVTYNNSIVDESFTITKAVSGYECAIQLWDNKTWILPDRPLVDEKFGLQHDHVTATERLNKALTELPISESDLQQTLKGLLFIVDPAAAVVMESSNNTDVTDVTQNNTTNPLVPDILPPITLNNVSVKLIRHLLRCNDVFRLLVDDNKLENVSQYYNAIVRRAQISKSKYVPAALINQLCWSTEESMKKALKQVDQQEHVDAEKLLIHQPFECTLTIDLIPKTAGELPFTEYEITTLRDLAERKKKKHVKQIDWQAVASSWALKYMAENRSNQINRLNCRNKKTLKTQYETLTKYDKLRQTPTTVNNNTTNESGNESAQLLADVVLPDLPVSSIDPTATQGKGNGARWTPAAKDQFTRLYIAANGALDYKRFDELWDNQVYGSVTYNQFKAKRKWIRSKLAATVEGSASQRKRAKKNIM